MLSTKQFTKKTKSNVALKSAFLTGGIIGLNVGMKLFGEVGGAVGMSAGSIASSGIAYAIERARYKRAKAKFRNR